MARNSRAQQLSVFLLLAGVGHVLCQPKYIQTGTSYTFGPNITTGLESALWKFQNDKVVEYEDGNVKWFQFKDKGKFDVKSGNIMLTELEKSQSGLYEYEITVSTDFQVSKYEIKVIDAVTEPQVNCNKNSEGKVTSLECFLQPDVEGATFSWRGPGSKETNGKTLQITNETKKDTALFCTAENPLGPKTKEFYLRKCDPADKDNTGIAVGVPVGILALLGLLGVGIGFWWKKRRGEYTAASQSDKVVRPVQPGISLQENQSNSNNSPKDDGKGQEGSNDIGYGNMEKVIAEPEEGDDLMSESTKTDVDLPNTVIIFSEELNDEKAEEDQEAPESAEKGQGATSTAQETLTEDKNNMDQSNKDVDLPNTVINFSEELNDEKAEDADPPRDEGPNTVIHFNVESNEESAEGQNQHQVTPLSVNSNSGNEDSGS